MPIGARRQEGAVLETSDLDSSRGGTGRYKVVPAGFSRPSMLAVGRQDKAWAWTLSAVLLLGVYMKASAFREVSMGMSCGVYGCSCLSIGNDVWRVRMSEIHV